MPHDSGFDAPCSRLSCETVDRFSAPGGQRPPRIEFGPDGVSVMHENEAHSCILTAVNDLRPADPARPVLPALALAVLLLVWQPLSLATTMSALVDQLSVRGAGLGFILLLRLMAAGLGIAAGLAMFQVKPGAVSFAKASLIVSAAVDVAVYVTPWSPKNRPPGDATIILVASLIYYGAWFVYLVRSKRVRERYA